MFFQVVREGWPDRSGRFVEVDGILPKVGMFMRIQDEDVLYQGDFLIVEVVQPKPISVTQQYSWLVLAPLSVQGEIPKLYTLIEKAKS